MIFDDKGVDRPTPRAAAARVPDWRKRGKILLASKLEVGGHKDNRKGRGGGAEQSATYEHMTPFCKSFGCLVDRWRMSQVDELPLLPASPANKTVISFIDNDAKLRGFFGVIQGKSTACTLEIMVLHFLLILLLLKFCLNIYLIQNIVFF